MVLLNCWRATAARQSLPFALRPTALRTPVLTPTASFSTSSPTLAAVMKKKAVPHQSNVKQKGSSTLKIKKKVVERERKHAPIGDRRAQRKKLVLANNNATAVVLPDLSANIAVTDEANGSVFAFDGPTVDFLRTLEAFQLKQGWEMFHKPATLVTQDSIELGKLIGWVNGEEVPEEEVIGGRKGETREVPEETGGKNQYLKFAGEQRNGSRLVTGRRGLGKSILLLQAQAWAMQRNWVVITIPNAQELVIGHTEYEHDVNSGLWLQKQYVAALFRRIIKANEKVLKATHLSQTYTFGTDTMQKGSSLYKLVELGSLEVTRSWDIFLRFMEELGMPGKPPVLFTLDNFSQISLMSAYRNPEHKLIHAHDLALPALFIDYLTGKRTFWRGMTLAATSYKAPATPALDWALAGKTPSVFKKMDARVPESVRGVQKLEVKPLDKEQSRSLMQYYKDSGLYAQDIEETLPEKWVLSSGNPKELMKACMRIKF